MDETRYAAGLFPRRIVISALHYNRSLPDDDALVDRHVHFVAFLDVECLEERLDVTQAAIDAPAAERVGIGLGAQQYLLIADVAGPYVGVGEVKSLVGREAVDYFALAVAE